MPARVWTLLPELQPRADPDPDPAPHVDDQRGAAPDSPESPEHVNLSEYEIRRRANIEANNAQLAMFGLGVLQQQVHLRVPPGPCLKPGPPGQRRRPLPTAGSSLAALVVPRKINNKLFCNVLIFVPW